jgi:hypothetical protein
VRLRVGYPGTKGYLPLNINKSTVGIKNRHIQSLGILLIGLIPESVVMNPRSGTGCQYYQWSSKKKNTEQLDLFHFFGLKSYKNNSITVNNPGILPKQICGLEVGCKVQAK